MKKLTTSRRVATITLHGVVFNMKATPLGFEADTREKLPDPPPPMVPGLFVRDDRGNLELIGGKAIPVCNPDDGSHEAACFRQQQRRCAIWIAHAMTAAKELNQHLLDEGEQHFFGKLSPGGEVIPCAPEISTDYANGVLRCLNDVGLGDGDLLALLECYQEAIGKLRKDVDAAVGNSPKTDSPSEST